jgi:hypothetical protein
MSSHWHSNHTQVYWICNALLNGGTITHKTEIREFKGWRLDTIIHNRRKKYDWPIQVDYRGPENIAHYWLNPQGKPIRLRFLPSAKELADEVRP